MTVDAPLTEAATYVQEITGSDIQEQALGGKGQSLNRMMQAGVPVPRVFCVTVSAYKAFIESLGKRRDLRADILRAPLPTVIEEGVRSAYVALGEASVAIRSSAVGEDSETQSFAGQYETYLHVQGIDQVLEKLRACWASLWEERVRHYNRQSDAERAPAIAVLIQQMVYADSAGVLFTCDPMQANSQHMLVDACWGLGEGVVSGQVVTDSFRLSQSSLEVTDTHIRTKLTYCGHEIQGEIKLLPTPEPHQREPCLSDAQLKQLAEHAQHLKSHYKRDLDIEWALKEDKIWLLQARPITAISPVSAPEACYANPWETKVERREAALFSRMDTGEIVTGLMTPLGLSFCKFYQKYVHGPAIKKMGLANIYDWQNYMGYLNGHVYLNISGSAYMLRQCPPTRDEMKFTTRYATEDIDFSGYKNPYGEGVKGLAYLKSSVYWAWTQLVNGVTTKSTVRKMIQLREEETRRFEKLNLTAMSLKQLNDELTRIDGYFLDSCRDYMPFFLQSFALYDALAETCEELFPGTGNSIQNRIKASMNNLRTIEVTQGIVALVKKVEQQPKLKELFQSHCPDELLSLLPEQAVSREFWMQDFEAFLFQFGTRGRQEFELSLPRWRDDPTYLIQVMKSYLDSDFDLDKILTQTEAARLEDTSTLLKRLSWGQRLKLKMLIKFYSTMAECREAVRPTFIAETWFYRKVVLEVLRRQEQLGGVNCDDLPYIDFALLRQYVAGEVDAQQAFSAELIEKNRSQYLLNQSLDEPPMALIGGYIPILKSVQQIQGGNLLFGLAASSGQTVARARVITDLKQQAGTFKQGEILVAKYTDASWTPLFVLAAGVVTDIGSALSHSSIVTREFGVPAVVNTKSATTQIKTGDMLVLDGDKGTVVIQRK